MWMLIKGVIVVVVLMLIMFLISGDGLPIGLRSVMTMALMALAGYALWVGCSYNEDFVS